MTSLSPREIADLADRVENCLCPSPNVEAEVLAAFGLTQRHYHNAGWKFIYPTSGRPGSRLRPAHSLDDFVAMFEFAGREVPETIPSDPQKACAEALRSILQEEASK